jgi:release factor glutamine methyltransferase
MMKHAIGKRLTNANASVLEIGVGQAALLCIYLVRTSGIRPDGIDIIADRVKQSQRIARYNSISLRLWQSDLFERVENKYDFIFWNASYIPTEFGKQYNLTHSSDLGDSRAWDGGSNGTDAIVRFLTRAPDYLTPQGEILLGVNRFYVPGETISRILKTTSLTLVDRISRLFNPSVVYVLHLKGTKNAT